MKVTDERVLLLLGLLSVQPQHGYQINEFIDKNLGHVAQMKKATAYALLTRLEQARLVSGGMEQEGNRPARRVYSITDTGLREMYRMLEDVLAEPLIESAAGNIALMFIDYLDRAVALRLIDERISTLKDTIADLEAAPLHQSTLGVDLSMERQRTLLRADRDWLLTARARLAADLPERGQTPGAVAGVHGEVPEVPTSGD